MKENLEILSVDEFKKIVNGDYVKDSKYHRYYDFDEKRLYFDKIYLNENLGLSSELKPYFKSIGIYNSKVKSSVITGLFDIDISFSSVEFEEPLFLMGKTECSISFFDCIFFEVKFIDFFGKTLDFEGCKIHNFNVYYCEINSLRVFSSEIDQFYCREFQFNEAKLLYCFVKRILLNKINGKSFEIVESYGVSLEFNQILSKDLVLKIVNPNFLNVRFNTFINQGTVYFIGLVAKNKRKLSIIEIDSSDLGKIILIDIDLTKSIIKFKSSKITEINNSGTKTIEMGNVVCQNSMQKQLFLSQIKKVYESRGDLIEANKFQSEEFNEYLNTLKGYSWEKVNLWLNRITNNHGQDWVLSLKWILIVSGIFWLVICTNLGFEVGNPIVFENRLNFIELIPKYLQFLNPLRPFNFVDVLIEKSNRNMSFTKQNIRIIEIIESMSRLVLFYLEYQFVQAFRKFGKK